MCISDYARFIAVLLAISACSPIDESKADDPVVPEVEEPEYVEDRIPEMLPLEVFSPSQLGKKYRPIQVQVGTSNPGPYSTKKARIIAGLDGFGKYDKSRKQYVSETDRFGGSTKLDRQKVTGRFYLTRQNGRFWFVDPLGNLCFIRGVASLTCAGADSPRNRAARASKFNSEPQIWLDYSREELAKTGINAACAFLKDDSEIRKYNLENPQNPIVYAPSLAFLTAFKKQYYPSATASDELALKSEWETFCQEYVAEKLSQYKEDRNVLGFFSDNEISFSGSEKSAEAYFKGIKNAVRKFDPAMLYFGSRLHGSAKRSQAVVTAAGKWCDAIAVNYYGDWSPDLTGMIASWKSWAPDTPFIITEFYTKADDAGLSNHGGAGFCVPDQYTRAYAYQHFTLSILEAENITGWVWFRYQDDPENGDKPSNKGLFDNDYNIYPFLAKYMRDINYNVYELIDYFDN